MQEKNERPGKTCANLRHLDYIDTDFGIMPLNDSSLLWRDSKPLQSLTLVDSGQTGIDPSRSFTAVSFHGPR